MKTLIICLLNLGYLDPEKDLFKLNHFSDRLFYQKLIFLANEKIDDLNYNFNWYKRGPYSPNLTKDLFSIKELLCDQSYFKHLIDKNSYIKDLIDDYINDIKDLKKDFKKTFGRDWKPEDLEILASLVFINKYTFSECKKTRAATLKEFEERKPELNDYNIEQYLDLLERFNFTTF